MPSSYTYFNRSFDAVFQSFLRCLFVPNIGKHPGYDYFIYCPSEQVLMLFNEEILILFPKSLSPKTSP